MMMKVFVLLAAMTVVARGCQLSIAPGDNCILSDGNRCVSSSSIQYWNDDDDTYNATNPGNQSNSSSSRIRYGNDETCTITAVVGSTISFEYFATEPDDCDMLSINNVKFQGRPTAETGWDQRTEEQSMVNRPPLSPATITVTDPDIRWESDSSATYKGWKFCSQSCKEPGKPFVFLMRSQVEAAVTSAFEAGNTNVKEAVAKLLYEQGSSVALIVKNLQSIFANLAAGSDDLRAFYCEMITELGGSCE